MLTINELIDEACALLKALIQTESFSGKEEGTAKLITDFFVKHGVSYSVKGNNVLARNANYKEGKKTLLLNSHHDTVKVVNGWTRDPFRAKEEDGRIYGLGSNDAGASLVSLIACFLYFYKKEIPFNILLAASAEEENFGPNGVKSLVGNDFLGVDFGIVGEPTNMEMAIAEKGLIVIDGEAQGVAGHAARKEGENAIYKAIKDIQKIEHLSFDKVSAVLGPNVISVTQVNAGIQHNVVPDSCKFVVDLRVNECYELEEAFDIVQENCDAKLTARSFNNRSSGIGPGHPLVLAGQSMDIKMFGSATLSDQANMRFPTIKMGPGFSERSHTPDEFIKCTEIEMGVHGYIEYLDSLCKVVV